MFTKVEDYATMMARLYPEDFLIEGKEDGKKEGKLSKTVTFQVTESCNLACSYCYQICKSKKVMTFDVAKKIIDMLLNQDERLNDYITVENSPALILDFIGGEPFLEVKLIEQICDYFYEQAITKMHPWTTKSCISISSNGTLYFTPEVQHFLNKYKDSLSLSITLDGDEELHDSCRRFHNGDPSYKIAEAACLDWMKKGGKMGSKITLAPSNVSSFFKAFKNMVNLGYDDINANCVYEEGWELSHAQILYQECKKIADYIIKYDLMEALDFSMFGESVGYPISQEENNNWCGGTNSMLGVGPDGTLYPCLRYMPSSLGDIKPITIGHVDRGIHILPCEKETARCMACITRRSQSTDECFNCPIGQGCGWCSAYNYQKTGSVNKRVTYTCDTHKARSLANTYYFNSYFIAKNIPIRMKVFCPKEWAIPIIGEKEYELLKNMSEGE